MWDEGERGTWSEDKVEDLEGLLFVEGAGLGRAGANPSLGLQHRLVGPGQLRTAIRRRQRRVPDVELGKPELLDGGPIQRGPRQTEPWPDPLAFGEWAKMKARVVVGENGVWWWEKWFRIVNQNFHGVLSSIFCLLAISLSLSLSLRVLCLVGWFVLLG